MQFGVQWKKTRQTVGGDERTDILKESSGQKALGVPTIRGGELITEYNILLDIYLMWYLWFLIFDYKEQDKSSNIEQQPSTLHLLQQSEHKIWI